MKSKNTRLIIPLLIVLITLVGVVVPAIAVENDKSINSIAIQPSSGKDVQQASLLPVMVWGKTTMSVQTGAKKVINFGGSTWTYPAVSMPFMKTTSTLYYKPTSSGLEANLISATKQNAWVTSVEAKGFWTVKKTGYYRVITVGYATSPPGYKPTETYVTTKKDWQYISV
jgi:hypothetical protein